MEERKFKQRLIHFKNQQTFSFYWRIVSLCPASAAGISFACMFIHIWWVFHCKRTVRPVLFFNTSHCNWILVNISYHFTISVMTSDLYIKITALHVTLSHMYTWHTVHRAKVEGRFTDDLNHFASLIYTVYNPKRLAEMLNARLESPKLVRWGSVEGSPCLGLFFTYWNNGIKCVALLTH